MKNEKFEKESLDECIHIFEMWANDPNIVNHFLNKSVYEYLKELAYLRKIHKHRFMNINDEDK